MTSGSVMFLRAAHWVHTVSVPPEMSVSRRSASGAECGSSNRSARPGKASQADSPVSHSDTETPDATAVAATVNACAHRSGSLTPAVDFTTNDRGTCSLIRLSCTYGAGLSRRARRGLRGDRRRVRLHLLQVFRWPAVTIPILVDTTDLRAGALLNDRLLVLLSFVGEWMDE